MITLYVDVRSPRELGVASLSRVKGTLQITNEKGLIKYNGPVECDLRVGKASDIWWVCDTMRAELASDKKMIAQLKPDEVIRHQSAS